MRPEQKYTPDLPAGIDSQGKTGQEKKYDYKYFILQQYFHLK